jgi:LysM repeat protein
MDLLKRMRMLAPAAIAVSACFSAFALDLPTKKVNGKTCYYYKVSSNETVYGIANKYGISRDDIIKYNPSAADGLKAGQTLYFPVEDFKSGISATTAGDSEYITHEVSKGETLYGISHTYGVSVDDLVAANPSLKNGVKAGSTINIPNKSYTAPTDAQDGTLTYTPEERETRLTEPAQNQPLIEGSETTTETEAPSVVEPEQSRTYTVAVMLPFMLDDEKVSKPANQVTDFYKGFLIAADSLSDSRQKFEVLAYDTKNNVDQVKALLKNTDVSRASIIIAPGVQDQLQLIADYGAKNDIYVLNNFVVKDTNYHTNAYVLQSNVTTDHMYELAADAFVKAIKEDVATIPVILSNTSGKNDKQAFISLLKQRLSELGINAMTVEYSGNLHASTITEQLGDALPGQRYAFIPTSGSLSDFNKFAPGLIKYKDTLLNTGSNLLLFGYPEWTTFRSDALESMHKIDTTIYSRFFADSNSLDVKGFEAAFKRWYGKAPVDGVPSQALLGFDTGCYVFTALTRNFGDFSNNVNSSWRGAQSTFNFQHEGSDKGQVNESVYIIRFQPGNIVDTEVL